LKQATPNLNAFRLRVLLGARNARRIRVKLEEGRKKAPSDGGVDGTDGKEIDRDSPG
jgi:hypothetical protein